LAFRWTISSGWQRSISSLASCAGSRIFVSLAT
jgi:hypothetical protein